MYNLDDDDSTANPESIVTIMIESPKEPANIDFGVVFPQTDALEQPIEDQTHETSKTEAASSSTDGVVTDVQEPIDVNIPRDTSNIFYAYDDAEIDTSFQPKVETTEKEQGDDGTSEQMRMSPSNTSTEYNELALNIAVTNIESNDTEDTDQGSLIGEQQQPQADQTNRTFTSS